MNIIDVIRKALECDRSRSHAAIERLCEEVRNGTIEGASDADKAVVLEMVETFEDYITTYFTDSGDDDGEDV